jgi:tripartite-type tricarboxylate transporter receptor subunit TctC
MRALIAGLALAAAFVAPAAAQTWPDHPIRLVVVFPAGGPTDIIARVVSQAMSERLGQPIVIENRGGAGGVVGTEAVAKAPPDGYTLALSSAGALSISPSLQKMPYRSTVDLKPVTLVARVPELLAVNAASPARSVADLVAMAKAKPGALNFVTSGPGSVPHLAVELLKSEAKIDMVHVPFPGAAPAVTELLAGRGDLAFFDIPVLLGNIRAGTLRALGIGSPTRFAGLPDVPTMIEQGLPGVEAQNWYGLVAPAGTPDAIVEKINAAALAATREPKVIETLSAQGVILAGNTPAEFSALIQAEDKKWGAVVRAANIKLD